MTPERILTFAFALLLAGFIVSALYGGVVKPAFATIAHAQQTTNGA